MPATYKIKGLDELIKKCDPRVLREPFKKFFEQSGITVQSKARENAPVDTGQLRVDIVYQVDDGAPPKSVRVGVLNAREGSSLFWKAVTMEYGTGLFAEGPNAKGARHWPPGNALDVWTKRHRFESGRQVAAIIGKRGGLKPRRYLRNALKDSISAIQEFARRIPGEVKAEWDKFK